MAAESMWLAMSIVVSIRPLLRKFHPIIGQAYHWKRGTIPDGVFCPELSRISSPLDRKAGDPSMSDGGTFFIPHKTGSHDAPECGLQDPGLIESAQRRFSPPTSDRRELPGRWREHSYQPWCTLRPPRQPWPTFNGDITLCSSASPL